jgi:predicted DNA binding CopG/RHH family protein
MNAKRKKLPQFKTEDEERSFWASHSPLDFFDLSKARTARFPDLKPTLKSISIRLPLDVLENLKILANRQDIPYQSLAKIYLNRQIRLEKRSWGNPSHGAARKKSSHRRVAA